MTDTSELDMLRDMAREWLATEHPAALDHNIARDGLRDRWRAMAELGWNGVLVPEAAGGSELGLGAAAILLEEAGRQLLVSPLLASAILAPLALGNAYPELLEGIGKGKTIIALAHDEGAHHSREISAQAISGKDGWNLSGHKRFVTDGANADHFIVSAMVNGEVALFLVDASTAEISARNTIDGRAMADVTFDNISLTGNARLELDSRAIDRLLDIARLALASEMLGAARQAFEITNDYLKTREQFDRPIGSFQALQHRAAQMMVEIELTAASVSEGWRVAQTSGELAGPASLAKHMAGETLALVAREMIQMHGGIGMTDEHVSGRYLKWSEVSRKLYGDDAFLRGRWADAEGF